MTPALPYLQAYPPAILDKIRKLIADDQLGPWLAQRYPDKHEVKTDRALYEHVMALKQRYLKNSPPLAKVHYDNKLHPVNGTLGSNAFVSRVQGGKLKSKNEIRIATLFRDAPLPFLDMIVVHELAHLKEKNHDKAFYQLCCHMLPDYHQLEFDMRLWLTAAELAARGA